MRKQPVSLFIFTIAILLFWSAKVFALMEDTHKAINEYIAQGMISGFSVDTYLKNNLGFAAGSQEGLYGYSEIKNRYLTQEIWKWLGEGGIMEDRPGTWSDFLPWNETRSVNHFHNPLKVNWAEAGLNDIYSGQSSILWAQNSNQLLGGNWSWQDARQYFYIALTGYDFDGAVIASTQSEKDTFFARTFRAVGQQMHLVQDASVPEHTRNDAHNLLSGYEGFVQNDLMTSPVWTTLLANPISFDQSILSIPSPAPAPVPISRIIDTGRYNNGGNPNPNITATLPNAPQPIGLAEYTNANFLGMRPLGSLPLMGELGFGVDIQKFPYPRMSDTIAWPDSNKRTYLRKMGSGDVINHLAVASRLRNFLQTYSPFEVANAPSYLDDLCYSEYAQNLIPRAVGYSAGLLNYFFRGSLDVSWPATGVYAIADGSQTPYTDTNGNLHQQFTKIKAQILNTTPNEEIGAGTLTAIARYKIIPNYAPDLSNYPPNSAAMTAAPYSYSVSQQVDVSGLSASEYTDISFSFISSPIPAGITDLTLQVVFKGTIGNETDNAIAVGMKDITEPTHLTFWNLTDMFSLQYPGSDYVLYTFAALQSMAQSNPSLLNWLDDTKDGSLNDELYLKPVTSTFAISFWNNSAMIPAIIVDIPAGAYIRPIVLMNQSTNNYVGVTWHDPVRSDSVTLPFTGVVNQADQSGAYGTPTPVNTFRQGYGADGHLVPIRQHNYMGVVGCKPGSGTFCPYANEEAIPASLAPIPFTSDFN